MQVSKERLLEIEKELNSLTVQDLVNLENLQLAIDSNTREQLIERARIGGKISSSRSHINKTGLFSITHEQRSQQSKKNQEFYTTCPHCGKTGKGQPFVSMHISKCILQYISIENFIQEWNNPTMRRIDFAHKLNVSKFKLFSFKDELINNGLM